jgi:WD40 repeat protein
LADLGQRKGRAEVMIRSRLPAIVILLGMTGSGADARTDRSEEPPSVSGLAWSPDGRYVLTSINGALHAIDMATGHQALQKEMGLVRRGLVKRPAEYRSGVSALGFGPDGKVFLTGGTDGTLKLWEFPSCKEIRAFIGHETEVTALGISGDGRRALTASRDRRLILWDMATGRALKTWEGQEWKSAAIAPDGSLGATVAHDTGRGESRQVTVWDLKAMKQLAVVEGDQGVVGGVAFTRDRNHLLSAREDGTVRVWDVASREETNRLQVNKGTLDSIATVSSGRYVVAGHKDGLSLVEVASGEVLLRIGKGLGTVRRIVLSPGGRQALAEHDGRWGTSLVLWDLATGEEIRTFMGSGEGRLALDDVEFSPDGKMAVVAGRLGLGERGDIWKDRTRGFLSIVETSTGRTMRTIRTQGKAVTAAAFLSNDRILAAHPEGLQEFEVTTGKVQRSFTIAVPRSWDGSSPPMLATPDGRYAFLGGEKLRQWDTKVGEVVDMFEDSDMGGKLMPVGVSKDGRVVIAQGARSIQVWKVRERKCAYRLPQWGEAVLAPDGTAILTSKGLLKGYSNDSNTQLWDKTPGEYIGAMAFSRDGVLVAVSTYWGEVSLWDRRKGRGWVDTLFGRGTPQLIQQIVFSPDGHYLMARGEFGWIKLWDLTTWKEITLTEVGADSK